MCVHLRKDVFTREVANEAVRVHRVSPALDGLLAWHACEEVVVIVDGRQCWGYTERECENACTHYCHCCLSCHCNSPLLLLLVVVIVLTNERRPSSFSVVVFLCLAPLISEKVIFLFLFFTPRQQFSSSSSFLLIGFFVSTN